VSLRTRLIAALVAVAAVTVVCSSAVAVVVLDRRGERLDREKREALESVSRAVHRRMRIPLSQEDDETLPGVLRPGEAIKRSGSGAVLAIAIGGIGGAALAVGVGVLLVRRLRRPLEDLHEGTSALARGQFGHRVEASGPPELREVAESFNAMAAAIERDDGERRAWLDDLSHELRTPVGVIQAYAEALTDGVVVTEHDREAAERALAANAAQIGALLTEFRAERDGSEAEPGVTSVKELLEGTAMRLGPAAAVSGVRLDVQSVNGLRVCGNTIALSRVLDNLIDNAIRAAGSGGRVSVSAEHDGDEVRLLVDDDGPGIAPQDRIRAFDRLWRGDSARTRDGGQGLGLAIARRLVESADGTIAITDAPLGGARLEVRLRTA
jgi:signal transduction histidine kinase